MGAVITIVVVLGILFIVFSNTNKGITDPNNNSMVEYHKKIAREIKDSLSRNGTEFWMTEKGSVGMLGINAMEQCISRYGLSNLRRYLDAENANSTNTVECQTILYVVGDIMMKLANQQITKAEAEDAIRQILEFYNGEIRRKGNMGLV